MGDDDWEHRLYREHLCPARFRETGMIVENGTNRQLIERTTDLKAAAEHHWQQLTQRQ